MRNGRHRNIAHGIVCLTGTAAWPQHWDVDFKLHAPRNTTLGGRVRNGGIVELKVSSASRQRDVLTRRKATTHGADLPDAMTFLDGRAVYDVRKLIDFLVEGKGITAQPVPPTDPAKIYLCGFAYGSMVGLYAAALDERIAGLACIMNARAAWHEDAALTFFDPGDICRFQRDQQDVVVAWLEEN